MTISKSTSVDSQVEAESELKVPSTPGTESAAGPVPAEVEIRESDVRAIEASLRQQNINTTLSNTSMRVENDADVADDAPELLKSENSAKKSEDNSQSDDDEEFFDAEDHEAKLFEGIASNTEKLAQMIVDSLVNPREEASEQEVEPNPDGDTTISTAEDVGTTRPKIDVELVPDALRQKLTILLLGETGCGKSTCVNAIANYIRYVDIEEAIAGDLQSYIPTKFYVTDENCEQRCIQVGEPENENFETGSSSTQSPQVYNFETDKYSVFLVDTPGIGDCSGLEKDKENMNSILATLADYPTINAICVMMKSNDARLTLNLSYCLNELLLRLHRDSVENICFFFTNSRGTFYRPGDSLATVKKFIEKLQRDRGVKLLTSNENLFCVDNEAYRLVCAAHQGVTFTDEQKQAFAASWTNSAKEIYRFLDYAACRTPHIVKKTLDLNQARRVILYMAKPMADITQLTQDNMVLARRHKAEVENTRAELSSLKKKLKVPQECFEIERLPYPVTVCTNKSCVDISPISNGERLQTVYRTTCHKHCYLSGVTLETFPEPALTKCAAMGGKENCQHCKCHWSAHMHINFKQTRKIDMIDDPAIRSSIERNEKAIFVKHLMLDKIEKKIKELEDEQAYIRECSVRFGRFLNDSAIIPYNDVFEEHVKRIIEEERRIVAQGGDDSILNGLKESLRLYREERAALDMVLENTKTIPEANSNDDDPLNPESINVRLSKLFHLPRTGHELIRLFNEMQNGAQQQTRSRLVHMTSRWTKNRDQKHAKQNKSTSQRQLAALPYHEYTPDEQSSPYMALTPVGYSLNNIPVLF